MCSVKNFRVGHFRGLHGGTQTTFFPPLGRPHSERFKFLPLHKRQGAPMCFVKNFRVGQFSGPTRGLKPHPFLPQVATPLGAV